MGAEIPCWLRVTTQILVMSCRQYGIPAFFSQTSPHEETSDADSSNIFSFTIFSEYFYRF